MICDTVTSTRSRWGSKEKKIGVSTMNTAKLLMHKLQLEEPVRSEVVVIV